MDLDALAAASPAASGCVVLCSPHNPGGRVWSRDELRALADFCAAHDLLLVADEIHHDLVLPGNRHVPMPLAAPEVLDRLVMLTASTKTFNIAGALTGNVIIPDAALRKRFAAAHLASGTGANRFGALMATAAYAGGDAWVDALCRYLAEQRPLFHDGIDAIPGLRSMPLEATYLAWVDFAGTGMDPGRVHRPRRARRPHRPEPRRRPSARAARASCASTSPRRAPASPRRWPACRTPSPTFSSRAAPNIAEPMRTWVAPQAIAASKSSLMPIDSPARPLRAAMAAQQLEMRHRVGVHRRDRHQPGDRQP